MPASTSEPSKIFHRSVDDALGPRNKRFFGDGYKRAEHTLRDIAVTEGPRQSPRIDAAVRVRYPSDWSRKGDKDQRPHLSTVDVLVIGAQLCEVLLVDAVGLTAHELSKAVLSRARIKAGTTPVEEDLEGFAASARLVSTSPAPDEPGQFVSTMDCQVGTLRMTCTVRHGHAAGAPPLPARQASARRAFGDPHIRLFGTGFTTRQQFVEDVELDLASNRATAAVRISEAAQAPAAGLEAGLRDCASPIDAFVIGLQLGQLLLYALDKVPRSRSNTLWMRETVLDMDPARAALPALEGTTARLERSRQLTNSRGEVWRSADIVGEFHGIELRCSVAHRLP
ncbi:AvrD family protein [Streptomyces mirabilis]|uniref:AvrD family protein n=1 Tax=Streptomyces mirabilis TaxID=68239 RepID=UPI0022585C8B|nr:AvrD family protein [Streptomyces mirabilis]MCX4617733.1 AvrD family protein [Streptomyces mirabilis]